LLVKAKELMLIPDKPYSNAKLGMKYQDDFDNRIAMLQRRKDRGEVSSRRGVRAHFM
jgi:hypothetical protein